MTQPQAVAGALSDSEYVAHRYAEVRRFTVRAGASSIAGEVLLPRGPGPHPSVLLVDGSGPGIGAEWSRRWLAALPGQLAVVRWDKPGCGESTGDWMDQTIAVDRRDEVVAVADALAGMVEIDGHRLVALGISQGSWVVLAVASADADARFAGVIPISGPVRLDDQEEFRLTHQLPSDLGISETAATEAAAAWREQVAEVRRGASLEVVAATLAGYAGRPWFDQMVAANPLALRFVVRNLDLDPTPWLAEIRCPVLALWGAADTLVDVAEAWDTYAAGLGERLTAHRYHGADHGLRVRDGEDGWRTAQGVDRAIAGWLARIGVLG